MDRRGGRIRNRVARWAAAIVAAASVAGLAAGCIGDDDGVTLLAYTTPREVYEQVIPAFQQTPAGAGVSVRQSYGPSGDQSRAAENGLQADVLALALAPDIDRLVDGGIVAADWDRGPTDGFVSTSVVVLAVREGNPKGVTGWDDLLRDDIEVVTANPFSSGGAQWNIAGAYGAQLVRGRTREEALGYLAAMFDNVAVQPKGSREALQVFRAGKGDVLLAYESEAIVARQKDEPVDYVVPDQTVLVQHPIAVSLEAADPVAAQAFVDYALSAPAQEVFARRGYRSVRDEVAARHADAYPRPPDLFTVDGTLGGWERFREDFFAPDGHMNLILAGRDPVSGAER